MVIIDKIIDVLDSLVVRPIGVYNKDYRFIVEHLNRNIGSGIFGKNDGYSTPIGELSNPYYNAQIGKAPWFYYDNDKIRFANYLDYIKGTYGSTTSVVNINESEPFPSDFDTIKIGRVNGHKINDIVGSSTDRGIVINPNNNDESDTKLGKESAVLLKKSLLLGIKENDKRGEKNRGISEPMIEYFGLNSNARENGILWKFDSVDSESGRYTDPTPLTEDISPVYTTTQSWGNYKGLGVYEGFYKNLTESERKDYSDLIKLNKYKPGTTDAQSNANYLDAMKIVVSKGTDYKDSQIRYLFETLHTSDTTYNNEGHTSGSLIGGLKAYGEEEAGASHSYRFKTFNSGVNFGKYTTFDQDPIGVEDLLYKTNEAFVHGKYDTLIARFHTSTDYPNDDLMSSSVSKAYGMSHGRNLLRGDAKNGKTFTDDGVGDGYDNPYCRVWTYHHQYHRLKDAIRPFVSDEPDGDTVLTPKEMQSKYNFGSFRNGDTTGGMGTGGDRLTKYGVIGYKTNAGLVNIAPKKGVDIKNCMFSIENLAWKGMFNDRKTYDTNGLSPEQKGPFGGRIMWFPPYDIKFSENVSANWQSTDFIGRGESVYTYTNTNRDGNLSFKLLIDHPAILDYWNKRNLTDTSSNVDDVDSPEQQVLRFFAGCEMLTAREPKKPVVQSVKKSTPQRAPSTKAFTFFVFFPNDYSGQDDSGNGTAIKYLLNGVGTQYVMGSKGSTRDNADMLPWTNNGISVGGYEVRSNITVSLTTSRRNVGGSEVFVGDENKLLHNGTKYRLAKQIGSYKGKRLEWYYRVDNKRRNEKLVLKDDYLDKRSFNLNSGGQQSTIKSTFNIKKSAKLYPLTDVYVAFTDDARAKTTLKGCYNDTNVTEIKKLISDYGINKITVRGWASSHGVTKNKQRNTDLNRSRRNTVMKWLKRCPNIKASGIKFEPLGNKIGSGPLASDVSQLKPKLFRCAEVTVYLNSEKVDTAQNVVSEKIPLKDEYGNSKDTANTENYVSGKGKNPDKSRSNDSSRVNLQMSATIKSDEKGQKGLSAIKTLSGALTPMTDKGSNTKSAVGAEDNHTVGRYDNEAAFFKGLELNDPFMRQKITEKIKYFDPAFHSVSPEGFNARLTFLHQCTRQGPTIGNSDLNNGGNSANNLSFGRAPVCVLRIGDFYYTKIIISSLSIEYEPLVWDLNHEGIGAMPMIANISMSFHFIGGSDLTGPIARLQNALSFNYYANTEVYDDRAEQINYDSNGDMTKFKTFPY